MLVKCTDLHLMKTTTTMLIKISSELLKIDCVILIVMLSLQLAAASSVQHS